MIEVKEMISILINMGFLICSERTDVDGWRITVAEGVGKNTTEIAWCQGNSIVNTNWYTVYFPTYLSFETIKNYDKISTQRVLKYAYMKSVDEVLLLLAKAEYKNESIKEALQMEARDIKLEELCQ
jgi:predicted N-acyltransferase